MGGEKIKHAFEVNPDHLEWLHKMSAQYNLPDEKKALRVLLDFAMHEGNLDLIFDNFRCHHCGGK